MGSIKLPFNPKSTVQELKMVAPGHHGPKELVVMKQNETAFEGYAKMRQHRILAVPIVDENGKLLATLSNSHLRGLTPDNIENLKLPVLEFLSKISNGKSNGHPVVATTNTTFEQVLDKIVSHHLHRIWLVDQADKPIGVITLSDLLSMV